MATSDLRRGPPRSFGSWNSSKKKTKGRVKFSRKSTLVVVDYVSQGYES